MSQMTSTARVSPRAPNRPTRETPRLRVVTGAPLQRGGARFVVVCVTLLATGLIGLLLLNTSLVQGSFTLHDLRNTSDQLTDVQGALNQSVEASKSPANLAKRAFGMGMVPAQSAAFLRLSDGKVIGVAQQASAQPGLSVVVTPPSPAAAKPVNTAPAPAAAKPVNTAPAPAAAKPAKKAAAAATAAKPAKR